MEFIIKGRNLDLNDEIKARAEQKIKEKVLKYFDRAMQIELELIFEKNPKIVQDNIAEVNVYTPGDIIRLKDSGSDVFEAIDKLSNKLERQVKRYHNKQIQRRRKPHENINNRTELNISGLNQDGSSMENIAMSADEKLMEEELEGEIVKVKTFTIKPVTPEEAVLQMELLGHDFYVFINAETRNTAVVYKRKDKNYGLIEPKTER